MPVYPFDLNNDGTDEIYYVTNIDSIHILSYDGLRLQAIDSKNGDIIVEWPWQRYYWDETLSHTFRNFIIGGHINGQPVLITAQGTYDNMGLRGWTKGMENKWQLLIKRGEPGARGSHMCPVIDIDSDNKDELLWGERCINIEDGYHEFICAIDEQADRNAYNLDGSVIVNLGEEAHFSMGSKILDLPGEHIISFYPDGTVKIWADLNAKDSEEAIKRYNHPYYKKAQKLTAVGYNLTNLGGL
jgi:hypothetical protein